MTPRQTATLAALLLVSLPCSVAQAQPAAGPGQPAAAEPDTPPAAAPPVTPPATQPSVPIINTAPGAPNALAGSGDNTAALAHPVSISGHGFTLWPILLLQAQVTPYVGQNASYLAGDIAERPGFRLRRARFGFGGSYRSLLNVQVGGELSTARDASLTLQSASFGITPKPYFGAYMGIVTVPFSRSALGYTSDTALIDRPLVVNSMAPGAQPGALVGGTVASRFHYALGVYNGFQRSDLFYSGYAASLAALGNRFDNLAYAARVAASLDSPGPDIAPPGDTANRFNAGASYFFSDGGARDIHSAEGDLTFYRSGVRLLAEVLYSKTIPESVPTQPTTQTATIDSLGLVAEGGYTYAQLVGGHVRFEYIDPNSSVDDASDNWLLTIGLSLTPPVVERYFKAQVEFTHREEMHGKSLENDSLTLQTQLVLQ